MQQRIFPEVSAEMPDGSTCGPDMEYASAFMTFRASAVVQAERQVGDAILPGKEPDWAEVFADGKKLLSQTRDLRVLTTMLCAAVQRHGLPALAEGLELMGEWLQALWEDVHPRLEIDGELDPLLRSNAVAELADSAGVLRAVRSARFMVTPVGTVLVTDVEKVLKGTSVEGAILHNQGELRGAAHAEAGRNEELFQAVRRSNLALAQIQSVMHEQLTSEFWPDLLPLENVLTGLLSCMPTDEAQGASLEVGEEQRSAEYSSADQDAAHTRPPLVHGLPTKLASREDAFKALGLAREFFELHEPSHPAILLIRRIEDLQGKDFLSLVQELLPDGLSQLRVLAGRSDE